MKTILMTALLTATLFTFANPAPTAKHFHFKANENLKRMYGQLQNVSWQPARNNMTKAVFLVGEDSISVFFDEAGEYLATTHPIDMDDMPLRLRLAIQQKFGDCKLVPGFELESHIEHAWYFETQTPQGKRQWWKGADNGSMETVRL